MIWNESIECMERDNLHKIQSIRLKKIVEYVIIIRRSIVKKCKSWASHPMILTG